MPHQGTCILLRLHINYQGDSVGEMLTGVCFFLGKNITFPTKPSVVMWLWDPPTGPPVFHVEGGFLMEWRGHDLG